jgi:hypothetical protein
MAVFAQTVILPGGDGAISHHAGGLDPRLIEGMTKHRRAALRRPAPPKCRLFDLTQRDYLELSGKVQPMSERVQRFGGPHP